MKLRSVVVALVLAVACGTWTQVADATPKRADHVRFATFNVSLHRATEGALLADLQTGDDARARVIAETIQTTRPDVLLLNEFDHVADGAAVQAFRSRYLGVGQNGRTPIDYPYVFLAPVNTGIPSGHDLNRDGQVGGPDDAWGFGAFPGQYGMVLLSRYPIDTTGVRTFQHFRWRDMPGALLPGDPATGGTGDWYSPDALAEFPLSSKSHWDVPVAIGDTTVHVLASHPTPPAFDGPEQRNAKRNHDEIRFWSDYVTPGAGRYLYDDRGGRGGLEPNASFVVMGDLNADPGAPTAGAEGASNPGALRSLLHNRHLIDPMPASEGAAEAARRRDGVEPAGRSDPAYHTASFVDGPTRGGLRVDYVLPSRQGLLWTRAGVFWPGSTDPDSALVGGPAASDHRLVWVDLRVG